MSNTFCEMLKTGRKALGLSQKAMARKVGITAEAYNDWETGKTRPMSYRIDDVAREMGLNEKELMEAFKALPRQYVCNPSGKLCGECKRWTPDEKRNEAHRLMGSCAVSGARTERCDWCVLPVGVLA